MDAFNKLAEMFLSLPGIGPRQAKRFVYFLLSRDPSFLEEMTKLISTLKQETVQCPECFRYFGNPSSRAKLTTGQGAACSICTDLNRNTGELMVVAKDTDLEAMEKSGTYQGKYFVLGGTLALIERKNADKLRFKELTGRVSRSVTPASSSVIPAKAGIQSSSPLKEIILALSANPDGEHTADELKILLKPFSLKMSTLGRGLSTGSELEYADKETLKSALQNRSV